MWRFSLVWLGLRFAYFDAQNQPAGFEVELGNARAARLGINLPSQGIIEERAKGVDFTKGVCLLLTTGLTAFTNLLEARLRLPSR
ncbi:MAG: hypothetical protein ACUVUP_03525 [Thermaceae bacterium]